MLAGCGGGGNAKPDERAVVRTFLQPGDAKEACSQLTEQHLQRLGGRDACESTLGGNEPVTRLRFESHTRHGDRATVVTAYRFRGQRYRERFTLVRDGGKWLIDATEARVVG